MQDRKKTRDQKTTKGAKLRQQGADLEASGIERKGAVEALHSENEQVKLREILYRTLVDNMDLGISLIDADHTILMASAAHGKQFNIPTMTNCIGKKCFRAFERRKTVCPHCPGVQAMATGQPAEVETQGIRTDGSRYNVRLQAFPVFGDDGTVTGFIEISENITERKRAEEALREAAEEYRIITDIAMDGFAKVDMDRRILDVNSAYCHMLGYNKEELLKMTVEDIETQKTPDDIKEQLKKIMEVGVDRFETRHRRKDGQVIDVELSMTLLRQAGQVLVFLRDISERKQAEEALRASEYRYKTLFESASDAIFIVDMQAQIIDVNEVACKRLGYRKEELLRMTPMDIDVPEHASLVQERINTLREDGFLLFETAQVRRDGTIIPTEIGGRFIEYEGKPAVLCIARDITERKETEEALRESAEKFRIITNTAMDGFSEIDQDGHFLDVNEESCRISGYSRDEHLTMSIADMEASETPDKTKSRLQKIIETGPDRFESRIRRKDGRLIDIEASISFFPKTGHFLDFHRDITERKRSEEALKESESRFRNIIETSNDGIIFFDVKKQKIIFGNGTMALLLGCSTEDLAGRSISSLHPTEEWASIEQEFQKHVSGELSFSTEIPVQRDDGSVFYADISSSHITLGAQSYFSAFFRDITERKQAENLMQIQHELAVALSAEHDLHEGLRLCVDAAMRVSGMDCGGIYLVDEIPGAFKLVFYKGLTPDFVRSVSHFEADSDHTQLFMAGKPLYYNEYVNLGVPLDEAVKREGLLAAAVIPIHFRDQIIGSLNIASHTAIELASSARRALETIAAHIGSAIARLQSEEAYRKSKARFSGVVDLLPQTVFEIDEKGNFLFMNAAGLEAFGHTQEDIDKGLNALELFIPQDREKAQENMRKILSGKKSHGTEYTAMKKDGRTFPVIVYASPIIGEAKPEGLRGIAIDITERKQLIEERVNNLERMKRSLEETISALVSTLEARDPYTAGHQKRVADLAVAIAKEMGLLDDQIDGIRMAGLVHDIGKIYIPSDLLNKSNRLNEAEYELFKSHCQVGYDILKKIDFPWLVAPMVLQHHERQDGSGYPQGLYGKDIILEARILAVADVIEAMSGHRPYRPAYSVGDALEEILRHKDSLYDPEVVDACLRVFYDKGFTFEEVHRQQHELEADE